ncbi:MAG: hypothetical protein J6C84_01605 [Lachnospiraceae bacterium]|nr:hypothetical protein [Lachnospiraceae bacterium]
MVQTCQLILWELMIPTVVGILFFNVDKCSGKLPFLWMSGQMLLWAVFQLVCVPFTLAQVDFVYLAWTYGILTGILLIAAVVTGRAKFSLLLAGRELKRNRKDLLLWGIFWALLLFQLIQAVRMTYGDGDDAYYVAMTTITNDAGTMYRKLPYTGGATELDVRHGLAPFPIWIAFLAEASGLESATTVHIAVPLMLIAMTYGIFYLIGGKLFAGKSGQLPVFLIFTELLVLFGDYSYYTAENFMIARSRQGKAALGNIVIPALFLMLIVLLEHWQEKKKLTLRYWVLLCCVMITGCLCSTLGALLCCMLTGVTALCGAVTYRRWKELVFVGICFIPCAAFALLYLIQN